MKRWIVAVPLLVAACSPNESTRSDSERFGSISTDSNRTTYVISERDPSPDLQAILDDVPTDYWWVRIEVPSIDQAGNRVDVSTVSADLAAAAVPIVFVQNYFDSCNPADAERTDLCWLVERYTAGESGLSGRVGMMASPEGLRGVYSVYWEGITDRFDGPSQWHGHQTSGSFTVGSEHVTEVVP